MGLFGKCGDENSNLSKKEKCGEADAWLKLNPIRVYIKGFFEQNV